MHKLTGLSAFFLFALLGGLLVSAQEQGPLIRQWATNATASSEYTATDYSAMQATGAPDVLGCGDSVNAWASLEAGGVETLTLYYEQSVQIRQINIYLNYNPGTITSVALLSPDGAPVEIPNSGEGNTPCPGVHTVSIPADFAPDLLANAVQITLDQGAINDWTEIDAVEIVGVDPYATGVDRRDPAVSPTQPPDSVPDGPLGEPIYCDGNFMTDNGVVFTVMQMRPNSNYTATVVGLNGFDPVLVVRDAASGQGLCNDDNPAASYYQGSLPTTGPINPSQLTASQSFNTYSYNDMANIELVVGGLNGQAGEFILILEGMLLSQADGAGDPLAITITPGMVRSGINPSVYMFSIVRSFDPLIAMIDSNYDFIVDNDGAYVYCDDGGNVSNCWGQSYDLRNAYVSRTEGRSVSGTRTDAMLTMPINADSVGSTYIPIMRSYELQTFGDYVAVFHIGIGE